MGLSALYRSLTSNIGRISAGLLTTSSIILSSAPATWADYPDPSDMREVEYLVENLAEDAIRAENNARDILRYGGYAEQDLLRRMEQFSRSSDDLLRTVRNNRHYPAATERPVRNVIRSFYEIYRDSERVRGSVELRPDLGELEQHAVRLRETYYGGWDGNEVVFFASEIRRVMEQVVQQARREASYYPSSAQQRAIRAFEEIKDKTDYLLDQVRRNTYSPEPTREENSKLKKFVVNARPDVREANFSSEVGHLWNRANGLRLQIALAYYQDNSSDFSDVRDVADTVDRLRSATARVLRTMQDEVRYDNPNANGAMIRRRSVRAMESMQRSVENLSSRLRSRPNRISDTYSSYVTVRGAYSDASAGVRNGRFSSSVQRDFSDVQSLMNRLANQYRD